MFKLDTLIGSNTMTDLSYELELFYDGACPLCSREISFIRLLDRKSKIKCTDISLEEFDPKQYGKEIATFIKIIQCRTFDGRWIEGVEVFRQIYSRIGFRSIVFFTRIPGISHLLNLVYRTFAKNRLRLTGRCDNSQCSIGSHPGD